MLEKTIWIENLSLFNKMVQKSGGIMEVKSSYTDFEGDTNCYVTYTKPLTTECEIEYEKMHIKKETKQDQTKFTPFTDRRGRAWEWFIDESYDHMTCVRLQGETDFNSPFSFHFATSNIALDFINLLKQSN